jgi:DNA-binding NtrC family response regulator
MTARPILIIEDEHALGTALSFLVRRMGHLPTLAASGTAGLDAIEKTSFAAVVLDIGLPDMSGLEVLERLRQGGNSVPVLVITAHATLDHAIHSQKSGATGYLTKPLDLPQFEQTLGAMLAPGLPVDEAALPELRETRSATLIGAAPCLRDTFIGIARACAGDVPALITGPSGAGKRLAAAVIHAHSPRSSDLLEVRACLPMTEASDFERSGGGTLVLDEVTELSADLQTRLAAWLANAAHARVRVLATTSRDPREAVRSGALREDLYYALSTLTIPLPPLCERSGDIPALSSFFVGMRGGAFPPPVLTPPVLAALQAYGWPGNVRELRHVLDYAVTMSGGGPVFLSHLPAHVAAAATTGDAAELAPGELEAVIARWLDAGLALPESEQPDYELLLERIETVMLRHLLERYENRPTRLAAALRIHRATLRQKLRRIGLQRDDV